MAGHRESWRWRMERIPGNGPWRPLPGTHAHKAKHSGVSPSEAHTRIAWGNSVGRLGVQGVLERVVGESMTEREWSHSREGRADSNSVHTGTCFWCWHSSWSGRATGRAVWSFPKNLEIELPYDSVTPLLSIYPEKNYNSKIYMHTYIHSSTVYSSHDMEAT